ncbi:M48 family metallopeptidase [bacterium]|nr:M48 family metallopeptidase [candidate division CSSED10-310 bacterium]
MRKRRMLVESGTLPIDDCSIPFFIYRDQRARRISLRMIHRRGVSVVIPVSRSIEDGKHFLAKQTDWIRRNQEKWMEMESMHSMPHPVPGGTIRIKGKMIPISVETRDEGVPRAIIWNDTVVNWINPSKSNDQNELDILHFLKDLARQELAPIIRTHSEKLRITVRQFIIRDQRSRWGSWSTSGTMSLNWRLIMFPDDVIHYVVIHELLHAVVANHSSAFWKLVEQHCPHWRSSRMTLKEHAYLIHLFRSNPPIENGTKHKR